MSSHYYDIKKSEATEQAIVIEWANIQSNNMPELKLLYHVPNGGSRNYLEAVHLKQEGVKAGVPDLQLPVSRFDFHGIYIEMKFGKNKTSEEQRWWLRQLKAQGYFCCVCYDAESAIEILQNYLKEKSVQVFKNCLEIPIFKNKKVTGEI